MATRYEIPAAFSVTRASRAETEELDGDKPETPLLRWKDFSAGASGPAKLWNRYGPLHAPRGRRRTLRPNRSSTNVYRRGEALVLKPASNGTGFETDRGACGTLKRRYPTAAFDRAGRKECCRARQAGEYGRPRRQA